MNGGMRLSLEERVALRRHRRAAIDHLRSSFGRSRPARMVVCAGAVLIVLLGILVALRWSPVAALVVVLVALMIVAFAGLAAAALIELRRSPQLAQVVAARLHLRRLPLPGGHGVRSPRVGAAALRIEHGYVTAGLAELETLASSGESREQIDALIALADAAVVRGELSEALRILGQLDERNLRWPLGAVALGLECSGLLGETETGRKLLSRYRRLIDRNPNLTLLAANLESAPARLEAINRQLTAAGFGPITLHNTHTENDQTQHTPVGLARVTGIASTAPAVTAPPLVSVIVAMFNAEDTIEMALTSLLDQCWPAIEIIVVDDASTDASARIVTDLAERHQSISLVRAPTNVGAYRARRLGWEAATGQFITTHDADDWAHPDRIAAQCLALLEREHLAATMSALVRMTPSLQVVRRGHQLGDVIGPNYSSLMVRRTVLDEVGVWDEVRVEADYELRQRIRARFGTASAPLIHPTTPLTLALVRAGSLINAGPTGRWSHRHVFGARHWYVEGYTAWHDGENFAVSLPLQRRSRSAPFFAPATIRSGAATSGNQHRDVVMVSDFALPGGTTASNLFEISIQADAGLRTGLVHHRARHLRDTAINPKVRAALDEHTDIVTLGDRIETELVVVKYPPSVYELPDQVPEIHSETLIVVANQAPWTSYANAPMGAAANAARSEPHPDRDRREVYRIGDCDSQLRRAFGVQPIWMPVGPVLRNILETHHAREWELVHQSETDWVELIDPRLWARPGRPTRRADEPVVVGRHGRDSIWKWPTSSAEVFEAFPTDPRYRVEILGGADLVRPVIGRLPTNWVVHDFDSIDPATFLAQLDVFVNFVHPDMVEAFGRTILEALAVGVPVITEHRFAPVFGDAVICCTPCEVRDRIDVLMANPDAYEAQVARGKELVATRFSPTAHLRRLVHHGVRGADRASG